MLAGCGMALDIALKQDNSSIWRAKLDAIMRHHNTVGPWSRLVLQARAGG
jgi:hypothetical protein